LSKRGIDDSIVRAHAKLDRLSRNTRFLLTLIESGVEVLFTDPPEVRGVMGKFLR
jgi:hypothetical protein